MNTLRGLVQSLLPKIEALEIEQTVCEVSLEENGYHPKVYRDLQEANAALKAYNEILEKSQLEYVWTSKQKEPKEPPTEVNNDRICIVENEDGEIIYAYGGQEKEDQNGIPNSHSDLMKWLDKTYDIIIPHRWCGFYKILRDNQGTTLILYGESDSYRHNNDSNWVVRKFAEQFVEERESKNKIISQFNPITVILLDKNYEAHKLYSTIKASHS